MSAHSAGQGPAGTKQCSALVTGASSGIGRATAQAMADAGFAVYATARSDAALAQLTEVGLHPLRMDVTDDASMAEAVTRVEAAHGAVGVLVNNAGYALQRSIEQAPMDEVRRQFETNVFGPARLTQLVLPAMRERRSGRIITVGSMGGRFALPGGGYYHASKHAIEAITDALRLEVSSFGVQVVLIQPGPVRSGFAGTAVGALSSQETEVAGSDEAPDPYGRFNAALGQALASAYRGDGRRYDPSVDDVARVIVKAATTAHPRPRYAIGLTARVLMNGRRLLPDQVWDIAVRRTWPTN